jgi:hypothetical protein
MTAVLGGARYRLATDTIVERLWVFQSLTGVAG